MSPNPTPRPSGLPGRQLLPNRRRRPTGLLCREARQILHWNAGERTQLKVCSTHNFFDRMPLSITTLWMEQSTSVRLWVSVTLLGAEGEREFSCNCLEQFCPGTPARSASRAWSGLRPTSRIPSWSQSMLSTSSRTSAKVTLTTAFTFFYPDFFLDGWEGCKEHAIQDFPAMHNMAMEKFFIPTEICNQVNLSTKKKWSLILFSSQQEVCGAPPPTKPPQ